MSRHKLLGFGGVGKKNEEDWKSKITDNMQIYLNPCFPISKTTQKKPMKWSNTWYWGATVNKCQHGGTQTKPLISESVLMFQISRQWKFRNFFVGFFPYFSENCNWKKRARFSRLADRCPADGGILRECQSGKGMDGVGARGERQQAHDPEYYEPESNRAMIRLKKANHNLTVSEEEKIRNHTISWNDRLGWMDFSALTKIRRWRAGRIDVKPSAAKRSQSV